MNLVLFVVLSQAQWAQYPSGTPASAQEQYTRATQLIGARQFGEATAILNELAPANPKWAELYAARCSAQLGLNRADTAAADCRYAFALKPTLYVALYGLATAEEKLKQTALATQHFQQYAAASGPGVDASLQAIAAQKSGALQAPPPPPPPPPAAVTAEAAPAPQPQFTFNIGAGAPLPGHRRVARSRDTSSLDNGRQDYCSSSIDCGAGAWCKDRGDGVKVCMNNGGHGDSCSSSIDCGAGGFCKDRGDGYKVCMNNGGANDYCSSSIDCGSGMWCRDRGDGTKVCMR